MRGKGSSVFSSNSILTNDDDAGPRLTEPKIDGDISESTGFEDDAADSLDEGIEKVASNGDGSSRPRFLVDDTENGAGEGASNPGL